MPTGRWFRVGVLALLAPAGVLCGHVLTYLLALPDPVHRSAVLAETGHGWWASAVPASAVLGVGGILWLLAGRLGDDGAADPRGRDMASWLAPRLAASQLVLFAAVEMTERIAVGHTVGEFFHHEVAEHGLLAQVVVALLLTAVCWCLTLTVELACITIDRPSACVPAQGMRFAGREFVSPWSRTWSPLNTRAPPVAC